MRPHLETLIGTGWDQAFALLSTSVLVTGMVSTVVLTWLRFGMRRYFVAKPDYLRAQRAQEEQHEANQAEFRQVRANQALMATQHSIKGVEQRQEALAQRLGNVETAVAEMGAGIKAGMEGLKHSSENTNRLINMVLETMIGKEREAP